MRHYPVKGFTLIELLVVVAIVAILAVIAIPSYTEQAAKGRRADAVRGLGELQLALERWRAENPSYANCGSPPCGSGTYPDPSKMASDYYSFTITNASATGYTLTATPKAGSAQADDRCKKYEFKLVAGTMTKQATGGTNCGL